MWHEGSTVTASLLYIHAAVTLFMTGLVWFVQVVHYPLMRFVGDPGFADYERHHTRRTGYVVGPIMTIEAGVATWLAVATPSGVPIAMAWTGFVLILIVWGSTALFQIPAHRALSSGFDTTAHRGLVRSNWIRVAAWTARSVVAFALLTVPTAAPAQQSAQPVTPVDAVDLERYAGLWYEVARVPNRFQRSCVGQVTAFYTLRDDGKVDVDNRCVESDGEVKRARGLARVVNPPANSRLEVSFFKILFWRPIWGDYWVIGLDPDYRWAIVGVADRDYGWVLTRNPELDVETWSRIETMLERQGYDPDAFRRTGDG